MPFYIDPPTQEQPDIHVGDKGTNFVSTIIDQNEDVVDLSTATSLKFRFLSPAQVPVDKDATLYTDGTDGKMSYTVEEGLFDSAGKWKYQALITTPAGSWTTNIVEFWVRDNISAPA